MEDLDALSLLVLIQRATRRMIVASNFKVTQLQLHSSGASLMPSQGCSHCPGCIFHGGTG